jgi:GNAT superfamily N-acetyltransferase
MRRYLPSDRPAVWNLHVRALEAVGTRAKNPGRLDADFDDIEGVYLKSGGEFLVGLVGDEILAMGALKRISASVAEITRIRVDPRHWRKGYGTSILHGLEAAANEMGYTDLWLDTVGVAAESLFRKNGYEEFLRVALPGYEARESILLRKGIVQITDRSY